MSRFAVVLLSATHQPIGGYAAMFRCVSRLQLQFPQHIWRAAFADHHQPHIVDIERHCHRLNAKRYVVVHWELRRQPSLLMAAHWTASTPLIEHPLVESILQQRIQEAHYTLHPSIQHDTTQQATIVIHEHEALAGLRSIDIAQLTDALMRTPHQNVVVQPIVLSQRAQFIEHIRQVVSQVPHKRIIIGKAIEYDRRLLDIVYDVVQPHLDMPYRTWI